MAISILNVGHLEHEQSLQVAANRAAEYSLVHTVADPVEAHDWAGEHQPDITVVDISQMKEDGIRFLRGFRADPACADLSLLALVNEHDREQRRQALRAGADEFITTPLDAYECEVRLLNLMTVRAHSRLVAQAATSLAVQGDAMREYARVREREILLRLARAGEYRDEITGSHIVRIGKLCRGMANMMGLEEQECEIIEAAAPLHDIGKIGISDAILHKKGELNDTERAIMKSHTLIGYDILKDSSSPFVQCGAEIALAHHEKFDGSGYPHGLRGGNIPLPARIVAVADVYDALTSQRSYKDAWTSAQACEYLMEHAGTHFDPICVQALCASLKIGFAAH